MQFQNLEKLITEKYDLLDPVAIRRDQKEFNFIDSFNYINESITQIRLLKSHPAFWGILPESKRNQMGTAIGNYVGVLERARDFNPLGTGDPTGARQEIANQIRSNYDTLFSTLFVPFKIYQLESRHESEIEELRNLLASAKTDLAVINGERKKAEEILKTMQQAAATTGVTSFAGIFAKQASVHFRAAMLWLLISLSAGAGVVLFIWSLMDAFIRAVQYSQNIQDAVQAIFAKAIILSFLSFLVYQLFKNYNANMHLHIINKHRENSLKTFRAFVKSTDDTKVQDAILLQATRTIFDPGITGFVSNKDSHVTDVDIFRSVESKN